MKWNKKFYFDYHDAINFDQVVVPNYKEKVINHFCRPFETLKRKPALKIPCYAVKLSFNLGL